MDRFSPEGSFLNNVLTLLAGTILAQIITVSVSPILTRLYTPEDFGVFALYTSIASILVIFGTCRYELAIVLPEEDGEARDLARLCILLSLLVAVVSVLVMAAFCARLAAFFERPEIEPFLLLAPCTVIFTCAYQTLSYWSNRRRHYGDIAVSAAMQSAGSSAVNIFLGLAKLLQCGLIVGAVAGQLVAVLVLGRRIVRRRELGLLESLEWKALWRVASRHRKFPKFNMPYSLVVVASQRYFIYVLIAFGFLREVGFFVFCRAILFLPVGLLAQSLGRVFFKEAAEHIGTPRIESLVGGLMDRAKVLCTPALIFFVFWAPDMFSVAFGADWREAGIYAAMFAPAAYCLLYTSWTERMFEVTGTQKVALLIQLGSDVSTAILIAVMLYLGARPSHCVLAYSIAACIYHGVHMYYIFRVGKIPLKNLAVLVRGIALRVLLFVALLSSVSSLFSDLLVQFILGVVLLGAYYFYSIRRDPSVLGA